MMCKFEFQYGKVVESLSSNGRDRSVVKPEPLPMTDRPEVVVTVSVRWGPTVGGAVQFRDAHDGAVNALQREVVHASPEDKPRLEVLRERLNKISEWSLGGESGQLIV